MRRYVQWAINQIDRNEFEVVRREREGVTPLGHATTMRDAEIICKLDRAQVLADRCAVEISTPERNVR